MSGLTHKRSAEYVAKDVRERCIIYVNGAIKDDSRIDKVMTYLNENDGLSSSDVLKFIVDQPDFNEFNLGYKNEVKKEYDAIVNNIDTKIIEWAEQNRTAEITKFLMYRLETPDVDENKITPSGIPNISDELNVEQVIHRLRTTMESAGRQISKDDALNLLISVTQNYITVFAGEPGTGKTSLCKLFAKALGLYTDRFAQILVERGWTSSKDLVGYYNPLTKEIEETL